MFSTKSELDIHFLNVGKGDCTVLHHPGDEENRHGRVSFVDLHDWKNRKDPDVGGIGYYLKKKIGSKSPSSEDEYADRYLTDPIEYFDNKIRDGGEGVHRLIISHPDMDHLSGLQRLDDKVEIKNVWDSFHKKTLGSNPSNWKHGFSLADWKRFEKIRHERTDHIYKSPMKGRGAENWRRDNIKIWHPDSTFVRKTKSQNEERSNGEYNDLSYVLKIDTPAGAVLLPGDLESGKVWERIIEYAGKELSDVAVLKAAHHGRQNGFYEKAVEKMDPDYVIISTGKKGDHDAQVDYTRACSDDTKIYSTRQHGWIKMTATSNGDFSLDMQCPDGIFELPG